MRILLVDDSIAIRRVQKVMLADTGLFSEIAEAADGIQALQKVATEKYDVILLDWHMPALSGIETLRRLKANPATASIPVIMVTAESQNQKILEAIKAGAANYIIKPFDEEILVETLGPFKKSEPP